MFRRFNFDSVLAYEGCEAIEKECPNGKYMLVSDHLTIVEAIKNCHDDVLNKLVESLKGKSK